MGWVMWKGGNQSNQLFRAVMKTFNMLYENVIHVLLKALHHTVHVSLFVFIYVLAFI